MALELASLHLLKSAVERLEEGFNTLPAFDENVNLNEIEVILNEVADRLSSNPPYPHPLYAGQMMKPPHAIARLAYALTLWINPNNHALEGGQASALMEKEAVAEIADMFG